jgi:hypothetical protein
MSLDIRTSLYIDTLQSQSLHDRSLEVNMDAVEEASVLIYHKVIYLGSHSGHNSSKHSCGTVQPRCNRAR